MKIDFVCTCSHISWSYNTTAKTNYWGKGQRAEMNSVKSKCANPLCSRSELTFSDLDRNLHNVGNVISYLHIIVLALELSIFKEHFKMYAKKGCSWTSVFSYPFGTHIRGLLNLWLSVILLTWQWSTSQIATIEK